MLVDVSQQIARECGDLIVKEQLHLRASCRTQLLQRLAGCGAILIEQCTQCAASTGDIGGTEKVFQMGIDEDECTVIVCLKLLKASVRTKDLVIHKEARDAREIVMSAHRNYE